MTDRCHDGLRAGEAVQSRASRRRRHLPSSGGRHDEQRRGSGATILPMRGVWRRAAVKSMHSLRLPRRHTSSMPPVMLRGSRVLLSQPGNGRSSGTAGHCQPKLRHSRFYWPSYFYRSNSLLRVQGNKYSIFLPNFLGSPVFPYSCCFLNGVPRVIHAWANTKLYCTGCVRHRPEENANPNVTRTVPVRRPCNNQGRLPTGVIPTQTCIIPYNVCAGRIACQGESGESQGALLCCPSS